MFMGGRSGGGGGTGGWTDATADARPAVVPVPARAANVTRGGGSSSRGGGLLDKLDSDGVGKIVAAIVLAFGALIAVGFIIYSAPVLLAEVALDAGVMTTVYHRVRDKEVGHWTGAVLRHTWLPALVVVASVAAAGYLLQAAVPEARSIGGVIRALTGSE
jgi:hypothetical protein